MSSSLFCGECLFWTCMRQCSTTFSIIPGRWQAPWGQVNSGPRKNSNSNKCSKNCLSVMVHNCSHCSVKWGNFSRINFFFAFLGSFPIVPCHFDQSISTFELGAGSLILLSKWADKASRLGSSWSCFFNVWPAFVKWSLCIFFSWSAMSWPNDRFMVEQKTCWLLKSRQCRGQNVLFELPQHKNNYFLQKLLWLCPCLFMVLRGVQTYNLTRTCIMYRFLHIIM